MSHRYASLLLCVIMLGACDSAPAEHDPETEPTNANDAMDPNELQRFGTDYAAAWSSQQPEQVAFYFAPDGSLTVNKGHPAVGAEAIAQVAAGFMNAFPDMVVRMDSLVTGPDGPAFHWTLTGTNSGPNGTDNKVRISGVERWTMAADGRVQISDGNFDAAEYERQIAHGVDTAE